MNNRWTKEEEEYLDFIQQKEAKRRERLKKNTHKKLVRDLIPGIIAEEGREVRMCTEIKGDSKIPYYFEKVREELAELEEAWKDYLMLPEDVDPFHSFSKVVEEGADLNESVESLFGVLACPRPPVCNTVANLVNSEQIKKRVAKGGFAKGFIMEFEIEEEE